MSKGNAPKERAKLLVKALLEYETNQGDRITNLGVNWAEDGGANLKVSATKQALLKLLQNMSAFKPNPTTDATQIWRNIRESLTRDLKQFLKILEDHRTQNQESAGDWSFTLKLWRKVELKNVEEDIAKNLAELDKLWEVKRSLHSKWTAGMGGTSINSSVDNSINSERESSEEVVTLTRKQGRLRGFGAILTVTVWEGREVLLEKLRQKLREGLRVLVITGQGGMGKSSLATKLMEALGIDIQEPSLLADCVYDGVIYFKVQQGTSFDEGAGQLLQDLGDDQKQDLLKPEEKINQIISYLAALRWLVVLDNLEDILLPAKDENGGRAVSPEWRQLLNALVYRNHKSQILITSQEMPVDLGDLRYKVQPDNHLVETVILPGVSIEAGVKILQERQLKDNLEDLRWMVWRVDGSVFLLTQLAGLGKGKPGYLRKHPELVTRRAEPILQEQFARQSAAARDFLIRMSILRVPVDSRGLTFVRLFVDEWQEKMIATDITIKPLDFSSEEIIVTEELLEKLVDSNLVESKFDEQESEDIYLLHQVIKDYLQHKYLPKLPKLMILVHNFHLNGINKPKTIVDLQPVLEAQQFTFHLGSYNEAASLLILMVDNYLRIWGNWILLKNLYKQVLPYVSQGEKSVCLRQIGRIYRDLGKWEKAENHFLKASDVEESMGNKLGISYSWIELGYISMLRGNWDKAESLYNQYLELMIDLDDRAGMVTAWLQLGSIARDRGNWNDAETLFKQCLEVGTEMGNRSVMANSWGLLGDIERNRDNWEEAESLYNKCLELETELGDRFGIANSWGQLGYLAHLRGNWDEAESFYKQCLEIMKELGYRSGIANSWGCLGENELGRGHLDQAEKFLTEALADMEKLGMTWHIGETNYDLAQLWRKRGDLALAQQHYDTALKIFQRLGAGKDVERIQQEWSAGKD